MVMVPRGVRLAADDGRRVPAVEEAHFGGVCYYYYYCLFYVNTLMWW